MCSLLSSYSYVFLYRHILTISGIDWDPGHNDRNPGTDDCLKELTKLTDNCSVPNEDNNHNKANVKAGGSRRVGIFTYRIDPIWKRYDYSRPLAAECRTDRKMKGGVHQDVFMWGRGWASGDNGKGFHNNAKGCREVSLLGIDPPTHPPILHR